MLVSGNDSNEVESYIPNLGPRNEGAKWGGSDQGLERPGDQLRRKGYSSKTLPDVMDTKADLVADADAAEGAVCTSAVERPEAVAVVRLTLQHAECALFTVQGQGMVR